MTVNTGRRDVEVAKSLQDLLSDLHMVYSHLHNFHWNVEGPHFFEYHEELQELYESVAERIDDVAERLLQIGHRPLTNLVEYAERSKLSALPSKAWGVAEIIELVLADIEQVIEVLGDIMKQAQACGDEGTFDFAVELLREQEKQRWFWSAASWQRPTS